MIAVIFWTSIGLVFYVYVGYPLLLAALARLRRRSLQQSTPIPPTVTVLISAYNEEGVIGAKLQNTLALRYPPQRLQVLVAADGSTDHTAAIVQRFAPRGVELSYSPSRRGKMAAISHAIERVRGEIVVFSDANNMLEQEALRHLTEPFDDPAVGGVSGAKLVTGECGVLGRSEGAYWKYEAAIREWESRIGSCIGTSGEIFAIRRELFERPPEHIINDDCYIGFRIMRRGYRVAYAPGARSHESVSPRARDEAIRRARIFAGRYQNLMLAPRLLARSPVVAWQQISHQYARTLLPFAMLVALLSNIGLVAWPAGEAMSFAAPAPQWSWSFLLAQSGFYATALAGAGLAHRRAPAIVRLCTYLVTANLAGLVGLYRFCRGRHTVLWDRVQRAEAPPQMQDAA